ncbi:MAG: chromosome segregation protein SMC [Anaerolineae bacterium]
MRLKHLELQGYKTFATKTEFAFEDGITAIVGPNGSGKSNIADAVRWVLGERSYSVLRAKRTEDMIFWGSERRTRLGMAQASITLDNSDGEMPVEYSEVTISRRAYRSGENEYLLNGSRVRLKDITELLGKSGLGRRTYTVIGQGLVDTVLSLRPDERRAIFEEAAGISIQQAKRTEAINKLEQTRDNILRVNDLINEIAPRLTRLEKQAERAQQYQELSQQLEELLLIWYAHRWQRAQTALRQAEAKAKERQELSREREAELEELELRKTELRAQQSQLRQKLGDWHSKETNLQAQAEEKKRELAVSEERLRLLNQQSEDIAQEIASLEANRAAQLERVTEAQEELSRAETQLQEQLTHLPEAQEQLEARKRERQAVLEKLTEAQDQAFQLATEAADRRNRLAQLSERREEMGREAEAHRRTLADHQAKMTALQEQIEALKSELEAIGVEADSLALQRQEIERETEASRERQAQLQAALAKGQQEETGLQARYDLLERMRQEESGYYAGADTVLQAARDGRLRGVVGPVASLIQVPAELDTAIEAALGPHLHDIVVETLADAGAAIQFLKRTRGGRATFLPLDRIRAIKKPDLPTTAVGGVIGLAVDLVKFERGFARVGHYLLGSTIIVRDFDTALRLLPRFSSLSIVTLTGEVIGSDGPVIGGPARGRGGGILAREREWRELPQHLAEAQKRRSDLETKCQADEADQRRLLEKLASLEKKGDEIEAREGVKLEELASQERQTELLDQEMGWRRAIEDQLKAEMGALDEKESLLTEELESLKNEEAEIQQQILALKARLDALSVDEFENRLAELKTAVAVAEQARENQRTVWQNLQASLIQLDEQVSAKKEKEERLAAESRELVTRIEDLRLGSRELLHQIQTVAQLVEPSEAELAALESEQVDLEKTETRLRPLLREYESLQGQAVLKVERRKDELTSLLHQIENDLGLVEVETDDHVPPLSPSEEPPPGLEEEIGQLRAQIKNIGSVNPNAPEEYEEVLERYRFLTAQAGDLEEAAGDLHQVIGELDELMKRDFKETFEAVRREFEEYFVSLFGGGAAELILTEPDDLMETGVDIVARPPGRREQRLALLSGGERALTAVALIFAILKTSPTPFCFLDEVDATLDESNVGRFREALQELSERTQFIVITHNRGTVEAADTIYGISMGEDSVSRVISLKLGEEVSLRGAERRSNLHR